MSNLIGGSCTPNPGFLFRYYTRQELEENNPSKADGLDEEKIGFLRRQMASFLTRMSTELKLNTWVIQTASVYCERFYAKRSFAKNDRFLIVAAALFLASKAMEGPRPVAHVAHAYFKVKNANKPEELAALARDPQKKLKEQDVVESIILAERAILYSMAFQIKIELPQTCLFKNLAAIGVYTFSPIKGTAPESNLPSDQQQKLNQIAVNFANDSYKTNLPLQYPVEKLAAACLFHSARLNKIDISKDIPEGKSFHEAFDITQAELDDIYDQLHRIFYAPKSETAKKGGTTTAQQSAPSPSLTSDTTKHPQHQPQQPGSQAAPIVLKPPQPQQSAAPAAHNGHPTPPGSNPQQALEEGEVPDGTPLCALQGGSPPPPERALLQQSTLTCPEQQDAQQEAAAHEQHSNSVAQQQQHQGDMQDVRSCKALKVSDVQGPSACSQAMPPTPAPQQQQLSVAAAPAGCVMRKLPAPWSTAASGNADGSRKRKAEELGEPMAQGLLRA